jgi:VCBS repeat-containing protein
MLKFINLKNLTACTFIALLTAATLISQPATANNGNGNGGGNSGQSCNSNNGHGNNADITITLSPGRQITVTRFDPSNPGNSDYMNGRINDAASNLSPALTSIEFAMAQNQLQQLVRDVELRGRSSTGSNCGSGGTSTASNTSSSSSASVENAITVTLEAPRIQASQLPAAGTYVVNFNDQSGTGGFTKTNGSTNYVYSGGLNVKNSDQWGGADASKYITQADGQQSFNVKVNQDQKYFGFWWSAGDAYNKIIFKNDGQEVTVFETKDLKKFINNSGITGGTGECTTSSSGTNTNAYCGNPNRTDTGGHRTEPFAYVNVFFNQQVYDEVVIQTLTGNGAKFESDNHTFSAQNQEIRGTTVKRLATAMADAVSTNEDNPTNDNVLTNDLGDGLIVTKVNGVAANVGTEVTLTSGAKVTLNSNGTFTYNPNSSFESLNPGQTGTDTFSYEIKDTGNNVSTANVTMTINGAADVPDAMPDSFTTNEDTATTGNVRTNDTDPNGDPLTVTMVNGVTTNVGTPVTLSSGAIVTLNSNGTFTYNPNSSFESLNDGQTRTDTFTYTISDNKNNSSSASVTMTITGVTDPNPISD